jgi:transcription initiation factor TFIID subunit 6
MPPPKVIGIYPPDTVTVRTSLASSIRELTDQDVAQSLAIDVLGPGVSDLLAADVEYRIHLIAQEAKKFMVHGKRSTLSPEDIEQAMAALNVEVSV